MIGISERFEKIKILISNFNKLEIGRKDHKNTQFDEHMPQGVHILKGLSRTIFPLQYLKLFEMQILRKKLQRFNKHRKGKEDEIRSGLLGKMKL